MTKETNITAVNCKSPEDFRKVFDFLHSKGYTKEGMALFNVFAHETRCTNGCNYVMIYNNSTVVKLASSIDRKVNRIKTVTAQEFTK